MTKTGIFARYKEGKVSLPDGGTIELMGSLPPEQKGKGQGTAISDDKMIYHLEGVTVLVANLEKLAVKGYKGGKIIKASSRSRTTELQVEQISETEAKVSGKSSFQALEVLGLANHVIEKN